MRSVSHRIRFGFSNKGFLLFFVLATIVFGSVNAQIIGGEVVDTGKVSSAFQRVFVYSLNDINRYVEARVSPDDNRYSFSNSYVGGGRIFPHGDLIRAEILDFENGFMAGYVDMVLNGDNSKYYSCSDCEIFSLMEFREVMKFDFDKRILISDEPEFNLVANIYDDCDFYRVVNESYDMLCERGCDYDEMLLGEWGRNRERFIVDCHIGKRFKGGSREQEYLCDVGEWVNFDKRVLVLNDSLYVEFFGNKSSGDFGVVDFSPNEYDVFNISGDGYLYEEDGYNSIEWKGVVDEFNFSYLMKARDELYGCEVGIGDDVIKRAFSYKFLPEKVGVVYDMKNDDFYKDCNFSRDLDFYIFDDVDFDYNLNSKMRVGLKQKISFNGNFDGGVEGVRIGAYVPLDFEVFGGDGVEISSSDYNFVWWNFTGENFDYSFFVVPRESGIYNISFEAGGSYLDSASVNSYVYVPSIKKRGGRMRYIPKNLSVVSPSFPIIDNEKNMTGAIYSKNFTGRGAFDLFGVDFSRYKLYNRSLKFFDAYGIDSNLGSNMGRFAFEYKVSESDLRKRGFDGLEFYGVGLDGRRSIITGMSVYSDGDGFVYKGEFGEPIRGVFVYGIKNKLNFWDRILQFIFDVFFNKGKN